MPGLCLTGESPTSGVERTLECWLTVFLELCLDKNTDWWKY